MAHSNSLDEIDQRILDARVALEEVKQDLQERTQRWHNIERLCGFPIITNPGLATLHQLLHGPREGSTNGARLPGPVSVDEADEDMPPAGYPPMPHSHSMTTKAFLRQRTTMGSTGSLSHVSRSGVNAAFTSHPSHSTFTSAQRGSIDHTETPSPTNSSLTSPVSFHLGEQHPERSAGLSYMSQAMAANHTRSKSITPSTVSSINSVPNSAAGYHGYTGGTSAQNAQVAYAHSRAAPVEESDDNLSQATMDSLPRSASSGRMRVNNNGLDLVNHTGQIGSEGQLLGPILLQKKPSKRKKLLNMFRKSTKQKPV